MEPTLTLRRRIGRDVCRLAAVTAAVMLGVSAIASFTGAPSASAAPAVGALTVLDEAGAAPLETAGSATPFVLDLPDGAGCTGDSASGEYFVQSFVTPASRALDTLTFDGLGPTPQQTGADLFLPLFLLDEQGFYARTTDIAEGGGPGTILPIPAFSFAVFGAEGATVMPPGAYHLGIACTKGPSTAPGHLDKVWVAQIDVVADASDDPGGFTFTVSDAPLPTTSTTLDETTTTTEGGDTTTTVGDSTTSIPDGAGVISGGTSGGTPSAASPVSTLGQLPYTGSSSTTTMLIWAIALLVFGRMAVLLARKPRVKVDGGG